MLLYLCIHFRLTDLFSDQPEQTAKPGTESRHKLSAGQNAVDACSNPRPMFSFRSKLFPSRRRQSVIARLAIVDGNAPLGLEPALRFYAIDRGINRTLLDPQNVLRNP